MAKETFGRAASKLLEDKTTDIVTQVQASIETSAQTVIAAAHDCCDTLQSVAQVLSQLG